MTPLTGELTDLATVRSLLGITDATQTDANAEIQACITAASRAIHVYTAREFASTADDPDTRVFAYYGGGSLSVQPYTLRAVTSLSIDTDTDNPTDLVLASTYFLSPPGGNRDGVYELIELPTMARACAPRTWREVTVIGTWGYETIPTDVARAATSLAAWWYRNSSTVPGISLDGQGDRFGPTGWPTLVLQLLASYRVIGFGHGG